MCTLRRSSVLIVIAGSLLAMPGCTAKQETASYEERRQVVLLGELSMGEMAFCGVEAGSAEPVCFSYSGEGILVSLCADNDYEPAKIYIQGKEYGFSFAGYSPQGTEPPKHPMSRKETDFGMQSEWERTAVWSSWREKTVPFIS